MVQMGKETYAIRPLPRINGLPVPRQSIIEFVKDENSRILILEKTKCRTSPLQVGSPSICLLI